MGWTHNTIEVGLRNKIEMVPIHHSDFKSVALSDTDKGKSQKSALDAWHYLTCCFQLLFVFMLDKASIYFFYHNKCVSDLCQIRCWKSIWISQQKLIYALEIVEYTHHYTQNDELKQNKNIYFKQSV